MTDLCLHIYYPENTRQLLNSFSEVLSRTEHVFVTTPAQGVPSVTEILLHIDNFPPYKVMPIDNTFHDWSGYLALLRASDADTLIVANDSIVNRRIIRKRDVTKLFELVTRSFRPSLVGELDVALESVCIDGRSSMSWVSSYMFGLKLKAGSNELVAEWLESRCSKIPASTQKSFMAHLDESRRDLLTAEGIPKGKLTAMYLERLLMEYATAEGFDIVSLYGGNWSRKVARLLENKFL